MKKLIFGIIGLCIMASLPFCTQEKDSNTATDKQSCTKPDSINPNGSSELAILMRSMALETETIKVILENKAGIPPYPEDFERILTATPTDSALSRRLFTGFAEDYLAKLKSFYDSPENEQVKHFNIMVNNCISCHQNFCHGPIKRIEKMFIK